MSAQYLGIFCMHHVFELLEKDLFVNIKVICVIIILCKVLSIVMWNRLCNYSFVEGVFVKFSAFNAWQQNLLLSVSLK